MSDKPDGLRTPLARVRFLGASRGGTAEAWTVHVTAVALIVLGVVFVLTMLSVLHMDYNGVRATLAQPIAAILLIAFIVAGAIHMEIGMRSIIIDYVEGRAREWALLVNACFSALLALACVYATLRLSFT
jgi:succinate dehydrogenase / fumarate reductase membrane anchor subunit